MMTPLFIDGFAGGGGASTGIAQALGRDVDIAINHSPSAIAIHRANHPTTKHYCQDIRAVWPRAVTRMQPVAGAWFSPDCKEHSKAKGGPVKDRNIRALPWEIPVWLEETQPTVVYLENVEEFQLWGPLDDNGHVIKERRGETFKAWVKACRRLGYKVEWRELVACDYGAPTSRKRLYVVMRRDGLPIVWPEPTHRPADDREFEKWSRKLVARGFRKPSRDLPHYRTAAECIDWTIDCPSIFTRKRELAEATKRRIAHGVMRYVVDAARPFIVGTAFNNTRASRIFDPERDPLRTVTTQSEFGAVDVTVAPHVTKFHSTGVGVPVDRPMPTVTANGQPARPAGAMPLGMVGATLVRTGHGEADASGKRRGKGCHDLNEPQPTVTSSRDEALACAAMAPLQNGERRPGETPRSQALDAPVSTIATGGKHSVITAHLEKFNADSRPRPADQPLDTVMASSAQHAAVTAFLSSFYTSNTNGGRGRPDKPLKTACAGANHHAVVVAHIEQANGGPRNTNSTGRSAERPLSTATTTGAQQRVVETTLIEEGALPPELMERATRVAAFLVKYYATDGENEAAQSQPADRPLDTITTRARFAVVTVTIDAVTYVIVDIGLRMLKPRELARAQGFPDDYVLAPVVPKMKRGRLVEEPLTIAEQISAIGNSVCPPVARRLVESNQPELAKLREAA